MVDNLAWLPEFSDLLSSSVNDYVVKSLALLRHRMMIEMGMLELRTRVYVDEHEEINREKSMQEVVLHLWHNFWEDMGKIPIYLIKTIILFCYEFVINLHHLLWLGFLIETFYLFWLVLSNFLAPLIGTFFGCPLCNSFGDLFRVKYGAFTSIIWYLNFVFEFLKVICVIIRVISLGFAGCPSGVFNTINTGGPGSYFDDFVHVKELCGQFVDKYFWLLHVSDLFPVQFRPVDRKRSLVCLIATGFNGFYWVRVVLYIVIAWKSTKSLRHDLVDACITIYHIQHQKRYLAKLRNHLQMFNVYAHERLESTELENIESRMTQMIHSDMLKRSKHMAIFPSVTHGSSYQPTVYHGERRLYNLLPLT